MRKLTTLLLALTLCVVACESATGPASEPAVEIETGPPHRMEVVPKSMTVAVGEWYSLPALTIYDSLGVRITNFEVVGWEHWPGGWAQFDLPASRFRATRAITLRGARAFIKPWIKWKGTTYLMSVMFVSTEE